MGKCGSSKQNEPDTKSDAAPKSQHVEPEKAPKPAPTIGSKVCIHGKHAGFAGHVHYAKGEFVGVALSSPVGKKRRLRQRREILRVSPSHGLMVRPNDVTLAA
ncbi:CAP Gly-rich domain [Phytophthora cactorum]|nr:CAP Gly-rich domain [Phytophthora cactorum]